ncbi:MAG: HYR domain-containing protein [Planctomycetes bacterium]|nr:HYR domain-containing protein [Planctomycetota bacterium]
MASCDATSGDTFPIGNTLVTCTGTDAHGNTGTASFAITITGQDTTPPVVTTSGDQTLEATGPGGAVAMFSASAADLVDGDLAASCDASSGDTFPLGSTLVTCTASDAAGNTGSGSFKITVQDTTPPVVTTSGDQTLEATGPGGAVAMFSASATDIVDGELAAGCDATSGDRTPLGSTLVTCTASDAHGNTASGSFTITVQDSTAPSLNLPAHITQEATGPAGAAVNFSTSASDVVDGAIAVSCSRTSGSTFPIGTNTVTCSVSDAHGNMASGSFSVTVQDTTAPSLTPPANITQEATGPAGTAVSFSASASDTVDGAVAVSCSPASGSTFPIGSSTVTCSATDAHGNRASGSFSLTVQDTTAPSLTPPANITQVATGPAGATVSFDASASDLVDGAVPVNCSPASGSTFPIGNSTVICSAIDAHGNRASGNFSVTVQDIAHAIRGSNFLDIDGNGARTANEPFLAGWTINLFRDTKGNGQLDPGTDTLVATRVTDVSGSFSFADLTPGTYFVREVVQANWTQSTPNPAPLVISAGENVPGVTFGNRSPAATLIPDPADPSKMALLVVGTAGNDSISFRPARRSGDVVALLGRRSLGTFHPTGRIIAYGLAGDDRISVSGSITISAELVGGPGNDRLTGARGNDILLGGDGNDHLNGGRGRDILIGGAGADRINGSVGDDLLIAGTTDHDLNDAGLAAILAEWTSAKDYAFRNANIRIGLGGDRLNGGFFFNANTVHDDAIADVLTGSSDRDWLFLRSRGSNKDKITDQGRSELVEAIS